jgi:hypothetical protein
VFIRSSAEQFLEEDQPADLRSWRDLIINDVWVDDWPDSTVLLTIDIVAQFHNASLSGQHLLVRKTN